MTKRLVHYLQKDGFNRANFSWDSICGQHFKKGQHIMSDGSNRMLAIALWSDPTYELSYTERLKYDMCPTCEELKAVVLL